MKRVLATSTATLAAVFTLTTTLTLTEAFAESDRTATRVEIETRDVRDDDSYLEPEAEVESETEIGEEIEAERELNPSQSVKSRKTTKTTKSRSSRVGAPDSAGYETKRSVSRSSTKSYPAVTDPAANDQSLSSAYESESSINYSQSAAERVGSDDPTPVGVTGDTGDFAGKQMYVAPKLGAVVPLDLDAYDSQFTWGGEIGFRAGERTTLGLGVMTSSAEIAGVDAHITPIMLRMGYYPDLGNGFFVGPQVGMVKESARIGGTGLRGSDTEFGAGIALGYDYRITPIFSTGLEINHATVFGDPDIYHLINFLVPLKVHF